MANWSLFPAEKMTKWSIFPAEELTRTAIFLRLGSWILKTVVAQHGMRPQLYFPLQNPKTKMPASRQARSATRCGKPYGLSQSQLDLLQENKSLKATTAKLTERCTKIRASKIRLRARCLRRAGTTDGRIEELERQLKHAQDRNHLLAKAWNEVKRVEGLPHRAFRTKFNYALGGISRSSRTRLRRLGRNGLIWCFTAQTHLTQKNSNRHGKNGHTNFREPF